MTGSAPNVTLNPQSIECNVGDTITVVATVTDADTRTEVVHGTNELGVPVVVSSAAVDTAAISAARWSTSGELARVQGLTVTGVATYGAGNLEITVRDAEGNETIAACKVTVRSATASRMLVGVDPSQSTDADYLQDLKWFPGAKIGASYAGPGGGWPTWTSHWVSPMVKAGMQVTFSAKDFDLAGAIANWDAMPPDDGRVFWYCPWTECNRPTAKSPPPLATYRTFTGQLLSARDKHRNAARIKIAPVFNWSPAAVGKDEGTPWPEWVVNGVDGIAWDQYLANGLDTLATPAQFIALPVASGKQFKLPVFIREFGCAASQSDAAAAKFIDAVVPAYKAAGLLSVSYFNYVSGVSGARITPTNRPLAFAAWNRALAGQ